MADTGNDGYAFLSEAPERGLIARVVRRERIGKPPYGRTSFELDCIDARVRPEDLARLLAGLGEEKPFAALRIVTTERRLRRIVGQVPIVGDWLHVEIVPRSRRGRSGPIVFHSQLRPNGYIEESRGVLARAALFFSEQEGTPPLRPVGSAVAPATQLGQAVVAACGCPAKARGRDRQIARLLGRVPRAHTVVVRDVGQGSFISLRDAAGGSLLHFDAGWPISFNGKTVPKTHSIGVDDAPVVLSHWDFDHLLAFYKFPHMRRNMWIAPQQRLGPGAIRVANKLAAKNRLLGWAGGPLSVGVGHFHVCAGPHAMNDTGLALTVTLRSGKTILLVGDAAYEAVGSGLTKRFYDHLVVTHHGAEFAGAVPRAKIQGASAVVSVGKGNRYRHPREPALARHRRSGGWTIQRTSAVGPAKRGDRVLGP